MLLNSITDSFDYGFSYIIIRIMIEHLWLRDSLKNFDDIVRLGKRTSSITTLKSDALYS